MAYPEENNDGVSSVALMQVRNNDAIARADVDKAVVNTPVAPQIDRLSSHIEKSWQDAKNAKLNIEIVMMKSLRQRHGIYSPKKFAAIQAMGGSEVYMLLTSTKCRAAEAWIEDILRPVAEQPWTIEPSPIPELPPEVTAQITQEAQAVREVVLKQALQLSAMIPNAELDAEINDYIEETKDAVMKEINTEATKRADRMTAKISDQLAEGGWHDAFGAVINDLVTLKAGILKGPVLRVRKRKKWGQDETGKWVPNLQDVISPEFERVSPFDIYPAPGATDVNGDYIIERHRMTRKNLVDLIGVPGFDSQRIRRVLFEYGVGGYREELPPDAERRIYEQGDQNTANFTWIEAVQYWGSVPGVYLIDWGFEGEIDPSKEYEIDAWKVGNHVIRAVLNPDKLGRRPYNISGYEKIPGSFWYKGVPELMADLQDLCNTTARALANNSAFASGPMVEVDLERVPDGTTALHPWKTFESTNRLMNNSPAVRYYQPPLVVDGLLKSFEFFMTMAEDQTGIPRWSHGNSNLGGAGGTSSGLSMLMTAATRGMKKVVSHIDEIVTEAISKLYDYNMMYDPDDSIKGDCNVSARGTSALVEKEQKVLRRTEFLASTANPIDIQLVGLENRAKMVLQQANDLGLDVDQQEELPAMITQVMQQLVQQAMPNGPQAPGAPAQPKHSTPPTARPRGLDNAGDPAGGQDNNLAQNQRGVRPGG